jgi:outer membrane protein assembly factor BamB
MRRGGLRSILVVLGVGSLVLLASGCDWGTFGFDAGNSRNNTFESTISSTNVATMTTAWTGSIGGAAGASSAVSGNGEVFIGAQNGSVYAFDQSGATNCLPGSPGSCTPLWSSAPEGTPVSSPADVNGVLYIGVDAKLYAFDATGNTNCSGTPKVCQPLWSTASTGNSDMSTPTVNNGIVYVHDSHSLYAFDATGNTSCSGTPKVCQPLWSASGVGSPYGLPPAVNGSNNVVYTVGGGKLYAFDATGNTNCSGTPKVCQPLWSGPSASDQFGVVMSGSTVYTAASDVYAYDATGKTNCSGTPKVCQPLWSGSTGGTSSPNSPMAVAGGTLYVEGVGDLVALDATGNTNCSGTPKVCQPLWTGAIGAAQSSANENSAPAVANGVVYIGSDDHKLYAFDATGASCSGSPKTCTPLGFAWTGDVVRSSPTIVNGTVFLGSNDGKLYAFGHPNTYVDVTGSPLSNVTATPSLNIPFSPTTNDYVMYCPAAQNLVTLNMTASSGTITAWGNTGSDVSVSVYLASNQAAVIQAPDPSNPTGPPTQYWLRCLPPNFPQIQVSKPGNPAPGYYFYGNVTASSTVNSGEYAMILDSNGTPVWYQQGFSPDDVQSLGNNTVSYGQGALFSSTASWTTEDLSALTTQNVTAPIGPTDLHEYLVEPNGDRMLIGSPVKTGVDLTPLGYGTNQNIFDCVVEEVDPSGNLLWSWVASDHVGINETTPSLFGWYTVNGAPVGDAYHCNSVDVDPTDYPNQVLVSMRNTSAIYDINKTTGNVVWKLSNNTNVHDSGEQPITFQNDPEGGISGQHDARFHPNNEISLYDDHTTLSGAARGVEYSLNTQTAKATPVFSYANPDGQNTLATGGFRMDPDGGNVIGWGFHTGSGFTEVDSGGSVLFKVSFPNNEFGYRSIKYPTSDINLDLLRQRVGASAVPVPTAGSSANQPNNTAPTANGTGSASGPNPAITSPTLPCTTDTFTSVLSSQAKGQLPSSGAVAASGAPSCAKGWATQSFTAPTLGTIHALFEATGSPPAWNLTAFGGTDLCTDNVPSAAIANLGQQLGC